jgi:hypothetical protein
MSDYLGTLARRARGDVTSVRPAVPPLFAVLAPEPETAAVHDESDGRASIHRSAHSQGQRADQHASPSAAPQRRIAPPRPVPLPALEHMPKSTRSTDAPGSPHVEVADRQQYDAPSTGEPMDAPAPAAADHAPLEKPFSLGDGPIDQPTPAADLEPALRLPTAIVRLTGQSRRESSHANEESMLPQRPEIGMFDSSLLPHRPTVDPVEIRQPSTSPHTVRVSIGRIEVRAVMPPPAPSTRPERPRPKPSLDDYLRSQRGGRR